MLYGTVWVVNARVSYSDSCRAIMKLQSHRILCVQEQEVVFGNGDQI